MQRQLNLPLEGLQDDGVRVDPVSGNPIPPGSMDQEVRDDIPANLSEGEYVVPADVVRYFGVGFFEGLREKAKQGMAQMEAEGRIGGDTGGPRLSPEDLRQIEGMATGGLVGGQQSVESLIDKVVEVARTDPALQGIFKKKGIMMNEGGLVQEPSFNPQQYATVGTNLGGGSTQRSGAQYEYKEYKDPAGIPLMVLFINGEPAQAIPNGYVPADQWKPQSTSRESERNYNSRPDRTQQQSRGFRTPLDDLNFGDADSITSWADDRLARSQTTRTLSGFAGLGGALGGTALGARRIAEVRAAALAAADSGNTALANQLTQKAQEAEDSYGLLGLVPDEWIDGDRIYNNYRQRMEARGMEPQTTSTPTSRVNPNVRPQARPEVEPKRERGDTPFRSIRSGAMQNDAAPSKNTHGRSLIERKGPKIPNSPQRNFGKGGLVTRRK